MLISFRFPKIFTTLVLQKAMQQRAGHSSFAITANVYDRGTKTANQEAANLINDFFNTQDETIQIYKE